MTPVVERPPAFQPFPQLSPLLPREGVGSNKGHWRSWLFDGYVGFVTLFEYSYLKINCCCKNVSFSKGTTAVITPPPNHQKNQKAKQENRLVVLLPARRGFSSPVLGFPALMSASWKVCAHTVTLVEKTPCSGSRHFCALPPEGHTLVTSF